jgi:6-phosphogluconolactonase (cycloisomerase 2 family)
MEVGHKYGVCLVFLGSLLFLATVGCGSGANTASISSSGQQSSSPSAQQPVTPSFNPSTGGGQQPVAGLQTKYVYTVYSSQSGQLVTTQGFAVSDSAGLLAALPPYTSSTGLTGLIPEVVRADPKGRFLYVLSTVWEGGSCSPDAISCPRWAGTNAVIGFQVNAQTGTLAAIPNPVTLPQEMVSTDMVIAPNGQYLYVVSHSDAVPQNQGLWVFSIDQNGGSLTQVNSTPVNSCVLDTGYQTIAMDSNGQYLYCAEGTTVIAGNPLQNVGQYSVASYAIDPAIGLPSNLISRVATSQTTGAGTLSSDGRFYFMSGDNGIAVLAAAHDGSLQAVANSPFSFSPPAGSPWSDLNFAQMQLLADPQGFLIASTGKPGELATIAIDPNSGALADIPNYFPPPNVSSMTLESTGKFLYAITTNSVLAYSVGPTGISQLMATGQINFSGYIAIVALNLPIP